MDPLYALIFMLGFGSKGLALQLDVGEVFPSKGNCEIELARKLNNARTHIGLPKGFARFGGACVLLEPAK